MIGFLLLGADDPGLLVGTAIGLAVMILVFNVLRRMDKSDKA